MPLPKQTGCAQVTGTRLSYEIAGSGHPLVLIHGATLDPRMWDDQFETFAQHYQVVRYDVRGFGQSALPTAETYARPDDLKTLPDSLEIAPAFIRGLAMGGGMAITFALAYPQATDALILVESRLGGWPSDPEFAAFQNAVRVRAKEAGVQAARDVWLYSPLFNPALETPAVAPRLVRIIAAYSGWPWVHHHPLRELDPPATQRLDTIRVPTLIIMGERDIPDGHAIAERLQQRLPNARGVVTPGVGHMANLEDPERFNAIISDFVAEP